MSSSPSPEFLNTAYTVVDGGWRRAFPWTFSTAHRDCYGTVYVAGDKSIKVHINRNWIRDASAAIFDINNQIRRGLALSRQRRDSQKQRARAGRPSKRERMAAAHDYR